MYYCVIVARKFKGCNFNVKQIVVYKEKFCYFIFEDMHIDVNNFFIITPTAITYEYV